MALILAFVGCRTRVGGIEVVDMEPWYVPSEKTQRPAVPLEHVAYLDAAPTNRAFQVLGYVSPPAGMGRSWAGLINAVRACASVHGADAVFLDSEREFQGWGFGFIGQGGGGGSFRKLQVRAKAIAWEN